MSRVSITTWDKRAKDVTGQKFGRLIAIEREKIISSGRYRIVWLCQCDCGNDAIVEGSALRSGKTKSCGCLSAELSRARRLGRALPAGIAETRAVLRTYKQSAKIRGLEFSFTEGQLSRIIQSACAYCGVPPGNVVRWESGTVRDFRYNGIDRVDNSIGYVLDNCVPCCKRCNLSKGVMSGKEFIAHCQKIFEYSLISNGPLSLMDEASVCEGGYIQ